MKTWLFYQGGLDKVIFWGGIAAAWYFGGWVWALGVGIVLAFIGAFA